jgi:hypothetical protein
MNFPVLAAAGAAIAGFVTVPAMALEPITSPCQVTDLTPTALACSGYYPGNLLSGSAGDLDDQEEALALIGLDWDQADWPTVDATKDDDGDALGEFGPLAGLTWVGIHYGAGRDGPGFRVPGGVTAFYRFDAGDGLETFGINQGAISSITLYETGNPIPEPATWAMLIAGFGLVGMSARRRRLRPAVTA